MAIAKYRFDVFDGILTISKAFEKNASTIGSAEQKLLSELIAKYGDALVIERYKPHKASKGLRYAQMENYIIHTRDGAIMMERFESVKQLSKSQENPYQYVKEWFLTHYPYYTENPEFDEEGFVVVKAEAPIANTEISLLSEAADAPAQTEEAA